MGIAGSLALAGAAGGLGTQLVQQAERRREDMLMQLKRQYQIEDQDREHRLSMERLGQQNQYQMDRMAQQNQYGIDAEGRAEGRAEAGAKRAASVYDSLFGTESGGNFDAANSEGYVGRAQFGQGRLDDFTSAMGIGRISTDQFRKDKVLQKKAEAWHFKDINDFIDSNDLSQYEGQTIGGVRITRSGIIAMAHLGGKNGAKKFLETGGQYDPADSNGTSLSKYARTHAGLSTDMTDLFRVLGDESLPAGVRSGMAQRAGIIGEEKPDKISSGTWIPFPGDPEREVYAGQSDDEMVPIIGFDGEVITRSKRGTKRALGSGDDARIRTLLKEEAEQRTGLDDLDLDMYLAVSGEAERILNEDPDITPNEAINRALTTRDRATKEEPVPGTGFLGITPFGRETRTVDDGPKPSYSGLGVAREGEDGPAGGLGTANTPAPSPAPPEAGTAPPRQPSAPKPDSGGIPRFETPQAVLEAIRAGQLKLGDRFMNSEGEVIVVKPAAMRAARG